MAGGAVVAVAATVAGAVLGGGGGAVVSSPPPTEMSNPDVDPGTAAGGARARGFTLEDQLGRSTSLAQFRGKVVVLAFVDARCTTICPLTTQSMAQALRLLGSASAQVQLLGIDANPLATRLADVAAYTRAHGLEGRWRFLTGSRARLARVWRAYRVYVAAIHGNIDHEPIILLIDRRGRERTVYVTQMRYAGVEQQAQLLADGIARLLPGHPRVRTAVSLRFAPPLKPTETVRLHSAAERPQTVVLGPGQGHLVVFFASWLSETSRLRAKLAELDRFATITRTRGWPEPVAVDETPTEASPSAIQPLLARLAARLGYPLVEDPQGRLGDGYGVQDLPWLVLTGAHGRVLLRKDGWYRSARTLEHAVAHALVAKPPDR